MAQLDDSFSPLAEIHTDHGVYRGTISEVMLDGDSMVYGLEHIESHDGSGVWKDAEKERTFRLEGCGEVHELPGAAGVQYFMFKDGYAVLYPPPALA